MVSLIAVSPLAEASIWPSSSARVASELRSNDPAVRRRAAEALAGLPAPEARRLARVALDDSDPEVRLRAVEVGLATKLAELSERVVPWLAESEPRLRVAAAEALARRPLARATGALGRTLSDAEPAVRIAAARALGASGNPDAVLPLLGRLDDSVPEVREEVVRALARLGDRRAVVPLIGKIEDPRPGVRRAVARALGELSDPRSTSALVLALRDPEEEVKVAVLDALGRLGDASVAPSVAAVLTARPTSAVRTAALGALGRLGTPESRTLLLSELEYDEPGRERSPVIEAVRRTGVAALPELEACLGSAGPIERANGCALALGAIGDARAAAALISALQRGSIAIEVGLEALSSLGEPGLVPTVLEYLTAESARVRAAARRASFALLDPNRPDGRAVDPIARALARPKLLPSEREELVVLLGRTGAARAGAVLAPYARDATDPGLREAALGALGEIGPSGQDAVLLKALDDDHPGVRRRAALALRRVGGPKLVGELVARLARAGEQDRAALALALAGPLRSTSELSVLEQVEKLARASRDGARDALLEALAGASAKEAEKLLSGWLGPGSSAADRAKIAEGLGARASAVAALRALAKDRDGAVRANALWALGSVGQASDAALLEAALGDRDVAAAGNAAAALGRLGARVKLSVGTALCRALADERGYVRANALAGLRLAHARCEGAPERRLLVEDDVELVRLAAARLLGSVRPDEADRRALERCLRDEPSGLVAEVCERPELPRVSGTEPVTVFVVPAFASEPVPRAPFALRFADGTMRLGVSDRRGAVFEPKAPRGVVELAVPAQLSL